MKKNVNLKVEVFFDALAGNPLHITKADIDRVKKFFRRESVFRQLKAMVSFLIPHRSDVKLRLNIGGGSYTDGKSITIGLPEIFIKCSYEEIFTALRALVGHESQHINSSDFEAYVNFQNEMKDYFLKKYTHMNKFLLERYVLQIAKTFGNGIEDGRIEKILGDFLKGYRKYLKFYNGFVWQHQPVKGESELMEFQYSIVSLAVTGILPKNFDKVWKGTEMEKQLNKLRPFIIKGIHAKTARECLQICKDAILEVEDYLVKLLEERTSQDEEMLENMEFKFEFTTSEERQFNTDNEGSSIHFVVAKPQTSKEKQSEDEKEEENEQQQGKTSATKSSEKQEEKSEKESDEDSSGSGNSTDQEERDKEVEQNSESGSSESSSDGKEEEENQSSAGSSASDEEGENNSSESSNDGISKESSNTEDDMDETSSESSSGNSSEKEKDGEEPSENESDDKHSTDGGKEGENEEGSNDQSDSGDDSQPESSKKPEENGEGGSNAKRGMESDDDDFSDDDESDEVEDDISESIEELMEQAMNALSDEIEEDAKEKLEEPLETPSSTKEDHEDYGLTDEEYAEIKREYDKRGDICTKFIEVKGFPLVHELPEDIKYEGKRFRKEIEREFQNKEAYTLKGQRRGILDVNNLWRVKTHDYNVFIRKGVPIETDCVATLLEDGSGSMNECDKYLFSKRALSIVEEGLKGVIPFKITTFNVDWNSSSVVHQCIKDFNENRRDVNYSYNALMHQKGARGGNKDGYSIRVATKELLKRPEKNKILIIFSDGLPSDYRGGEREGQRDVKEAVREARKAGILVISIVFGSESFRNSYMDTYRYMYEKNIISCDPRYIGTQLTKLLRKLMR